MKRKFEWGAIVFTVLFIFIIRFGFLEGPARVVYLDVFSRSPPKNNSGYFENDPYDVNKRHPEIDPYGVKEDPSDVNKRQVRTIQPYSSPPAKRSLSVLSNSSSMRPTLGAWGGLKRMLNRSDLPLQVVESFREGTLAWESILPFVEEGGSKKDDKQCPDSVGSTDAKEHNVSIPCGLILDSSVTVVATPMRSSAQFQINLIGSNIPGVFGQPPVILHYNVRFRGDSLTDETVIIQNTWTEAGHWGEEERCPSPVEHKPSQGQDCDVAG